VVRALRWTLLGLAVLATAAAPAPPAPAQEPSVTERLQRRIRLHLEEVARADFASAEEPLRANGGRLYAARAMRRFYEERLYLPAWIDARGEVRRRARALLRGIDSADEHGLRPADYHAAQIDSLLVELRKSARGTNPAGAEATDRLLTEIDLLLTDAFLSYGAHLVSGRVDPRSIDPLWTVNGRGTDMAAVLRRTLEEGRPPDEALARLAPEHEEYGLLRKALAEHRSVAEAGGWPTVPEGGTLHPGDSGDRVPVLRRRLAASGDLSAEAAAETADSAVFGPRLEEAVRRFQRRHGLTPDGLVGRETLAALNVPARRRAEQIRLNLERWRWLPSEFAYRHLRVNIADFEMQAVEGDSTVLSMRTVVGRDYRQTPVFSDTMRYVVVNPSWSVPRSIAESDILPRLRESTSYLREQDMVVYSGWEADASRVDPATVDWASLSADSFPYRFVQRPGPANALGRVKFMFPNQFSVYIHDSPSRGLFGRSVRSFSSGCIRVERPLELLDYVFRGSDRWTPDSLRAVLDAGRERTIPIPRELPVHIEYWTAWVARDGTVHFRPDVYGRDRRLEPALAAGPPGD